MTDEELAAIRRRCEAATGGPWTSASAYDPNPGGVVLAALGCDEWGVESDAKDIAEPRVDAEFIAHARTDIPALLAEVERLRERLDDAGRRFLWANNFAEEIRRDLNLYFPEDAE